MIESANEQSQNKDMLIAVVQAQDAEMAVETLTNEGVFITQLPSVGGFMGQKSATLIIGFEDHLRDQVIELLKNNCRQRVAFIAVPMENSPLPMPAPTPVTIGGASVFQISVDHYEEI